MAGGGIEGRTGEVYDSLWEPWSENDFRKYRSRFEGLIPGKFYKGKTCLDAGCGQGIISSILVRGAKSVICVDIGAAAVRLTKRNAPGAKVVQASISRLPFKGARFDLITSIGVLHHIPGGVGENLPKLAKLLKPGGRIVLGLYGKEGFLWIGIEAASRIIGLLPFRLAEGALRLLGFPPLMRYLVLDYAYVPLRLRYGKLEVVRLLRLNGFSEIEFLRDRPDNLLSRLGAGKNFFYVAARKGR